MTDESAEKDDKVQVILDRPVWLAPQLTEYDIVGSTGAADGLSDDGFSGLES